jgi:hypothetical protein
VPVSLRSGCQACASHDGGPRCERFIGYLIDLDVMFTEGHTGELSESPPESS